MTLPRGATVARAADACRIALETFASLEPTRSALAEWLSTAYRAALVNPQKPPSFSVGEPPEIECAIEDAQRQLACMRKEARRPESDFIASLPQRVNIVRVRDSEGKIGFGPIDVPNMPLVARVLSLFLADYLARPEHYLTTAA